MFDRILNTYTVLQIPQFKRQKVARGDMPLSALFNILLIDIHFSTSIYLYLARLLLLVPLGYINVHSKVHLFSLSLFL